MGHLAIDLLFRRREDFFAQINAHSKPWLLVFLLKGESRGKRAYLAGSNFFAFACFLFEAICRALANTLIFSRLNRILVALIFLSLFALGCLQLLQLSYSVGLIAQLVSTASIMTIII
jgi:hypothetical protein